MTFRPEKSNERGAYECLGVLICTVLAMLLISSLVMRVFRVDGASMRETLQDGDILLVLNDPLCGNYERGDIVVLRKAGFRDGAPIVKRVIATEGQTVEIDFEKGAVFVDGEKLEEDYIREPTWTPEGLEFPVTVPEGHLFVLGDNRNASSDSRSRELGTIDTRMVMGQAVLLAVPGKTAGLDRREWSRTGLLQ